MPLFDIIVTWQPIFLMMCPPGGQHHFFLDFWLCFRNLYSDIYALLILGFCFWFLVLLQKFVICRYSDLYGPHLLGFMPAVFFSFCWCEQSMNLGTGVLDVDCSWLILLTQDSWFAACCVLLVEPHHFYLLSGSVPEICSILISMRCPTSFFSNFISGPASENCILISTHKLVSWQCFFAICLCQHFLWTVAQAVQKLNAPDWYFVAWQLIFLMMCPTGWTASFFLDFWFCFRNLYYDINALFTLGFCFWFLVLLQKSEICILISTDRTHWVSCQ